MLLLFIIDILTVETGDRVWWKWQKPTASIAVRLSEARLLFDSKLKLSRCDEPSSSSSSSHGQCEQLDENALSRAGVYSYRIKDPGCYYFLISNGVLNSITTVIATSAQKASIPFENAIFFFLLFSFHNVNARIMLYCINLISTLILYKILTKRKENAGKFLNDFSHFAFKNDALILIFFDIIASHKTLQPATH
jgi:hypothetical protein